MSTNPILTPTVCTKGEIYGVMIQKMKDAGWTDVASKPATEYNVMYSPGLDVENPTPMWVNLRPVDRAGNNSVVTTTYGTMSMCFLRGYTPGDEGVAGTTLPASSPSINAYMLTGSWAPDTPGFKLYSYCDKQNCIFALYTPTMNADGFVFTFGMPRKEDVWYALAPERDFYATATGGTANNSLGYSVNYGFMFNDAPIFAAGSAGAVSYSAAFDAPLLTPDWSGQYRLNDIKIGNATIGARLNSVYGLKLLPSNQAAIGNGDEFLDGLTNERWKLTFSNNPASSAGSNGLVTNRILFRVA